MDDTTGWTQVQMEDKIKSYLKEIMCEGAD